MNYIIAQENIIIKGIWVLKGSKYTLNSEGNFHSFKDLPAIIHPDGYQAWFLNGKLHRSDGPAVIHSDGPQYWYLNGELHREDGPALIEPNGTQHWYLNGELHREDGPAIIESDGSQVWYLKGKLHRIDGPAVINSNGYQEWWLKGKQVRPIKVLKIMKAKGLNLTHFTLDKDKKIREAIKELL